MRPCLVLVGNEAWYNWYREEINELVNWAQAHKIRVCTRKRVSGYNETGFFTINPIKQFRLGLQFSESGINGGQIDSYNLTPTVSDSQIDKAYAAAKL